MNLNQRIISIAIFGISIAGLSTLLQPALSLIVVDALSQESPSASPAARNNAPVKLSLRAFQKVMSEEPETGERRYVYLPVKQGEKVKHGTILRYIMSAKNGSSPVKNLALNQVIPKNTSYLVNSAKTNIDGELLFSIDGGKTYTPQPTLDGQMAHPSTYTNIRWRFKNVIPPQAKIQATIEVEVK